MGVLVEEYEGEYVLSCLACVLRPFGFNAKPPLSFTVGTDGKVKVAGKLAGMSVSGSTMLRINGMNVVFLNDDIAIEAALE